MTSATPRQTFALFCGTKIDVRPLNLTLEEAGALIGLMKEDMSAVLGRLGELASERGVVLTSKGSAKGSIDFESLYNSAHEAGMQAGRGVRPTPMQVVERLNPLDDSSPIVRDYGVYSEGACGFASVIIRPGNCAFANWLKKNKGCRRAYRGGVQIWVSEFNQSIDRKEAYAGEFARVISEAKLPNTQVFVDSRLD